MRFALSLCLGLAALLVLASGCSSLSSHPVRPNLNVWMLDPSTTSLRGFEAASDKPLSDCQSYDANGSGFAQKPDKMVCYVLDGDSFAALKNYIREVEDDQKLITPSL